MTRNVGTLDRLLRAALGAGLLAAAFVIAQPVLQIAAIALGLVMLAVAATRVCPAYALFGASTCRG